MTFYSWSFNVVTPPVELFAPVVNGEILCQEINFYTYWQGFGYAESTPKIKYLLVAQDWGNLNLTQDFIDKIGNLNAGDRIPLYSEKPNGMGTDPNLFDLFKILGYDLSKRYDELFFTNFCLGYRPHDAKTVGGMTKEIMIQDAELFKRLCGILEPENILCLGRLTFECVYESLTGKNYSVSGGYNNFLENHEEFVVRCGNVESKIFPLAHCGYMGTIARNKNLPKHDDRLFYQKQDWKKIIGEKKIVTEFTRKFLSNKFLTKKFFSNARFIHVSASGAMGDAGVAEVWTKNFEHYRCYWPGVVNIDKFCKFFMRETDYPYFDLPAKDGRSSHYMGCGHNFYIKEELNATYLKKFDDGQKNGAGYPYDEDVFPVEEIMLEILNESPENNFSPTENDLVEMGKHLESAINKFDLQDNIKIYRRADISLLKVFDKILQVGGIFQDDGFTSCTTLKIGSTENEVEIVVLVPKGKGYGAYIAPISAFPEECEFVLNHGSIFKRLYSQRKKVKLWL